MLLDCAPRPPARDSVGVVLEFGDDRAGHLLADAVGHADHRQLLDERGVAVEILDLVGVDVLAVGVDDDVLRAPDEVQVAVLVEAPEIAGVEPAVADRLAAVASSSSQ